MTSDNVVEICKEYFYRDITCFETCHEIVEKITTGAKGCLGSENVTKNNYTIDWFKITVPDSSFSVTMRNAGAQMQSVQAAKALLREKKFLK